MMKTILSLFIASLLVFTSLPEKILPLAGSVPGSAYIEGVVGHAQGFSLSCESRSAADWANFWGVSLRENEILYELPSSDNPEIGFVGDPNDEWGNIPPASYGVHAAPVAAVLRNHGLQAKAYKGLEWEDLKAEVSAGRPVIVWIIGQMWQGHPVEYSAQDGNTVTVARYEHTMILIGYEPGFVYVVDAYSGLTLTYSVDAFLTSWATLGNMAILGQKKPAEHAATPVKTPRPTRAAAPELQAQTFRAWLPSVVRPALKFKRLRKKQQDSTIDKAPAAYTVQQGDFLIALAERFNLDWRDLAQLNDLQYPYVLYPGQELKLK